MSQEAPKSISLLLAAARQGDRVAHDRLWELAMDEVQRIARRLLAKEKARNQTETQSLVNEAYVRLKGSDELDFADRRHFYGVLGKIMQQILIDRGRKRRRLKHGGGHHILPLDEEPAGTDATDHTDHVALKEALERLAQVEPLKAEIVQLRYYSGRTVEETAELVGVAPRTVNEEWRQARAWLARELSKGDSHAADRGGDDVT